MTTRLQAFLFSIGIALLLSGLMIGCDSKGAASEAAKGAPLTVVAAADLKFALDELLSEFRTAHPDNVVRVTYGSSGNFFAQLQNRAPFDIYFSADVEYPRKLAKAGLALDNDVFLYAIGRIVVWAPNDSALDLDALGIEALAHPSVQKVAIANPEHAPYGRAAVAALRTLGIHDRVQARFVLGENISQTAQFIESGAADIGIIALSLALAPQMASKGRFWEVPLDAYPAMEQGGLITQWTGDPTGARRLRDFVLSDHGRGILKRYGFFLPQ